MKIKFLAVFTATVVLCLALGLNALAQGKGGGNKGGGGGKPSNAGQSASHGNSGNRGNSGNKSNDTNSTDVVTGDDHGKPDKGAQNAAKARDKAAKMSDKDLNRYKGLSKKLGTTPEEMRARYQAALLRNPDLSYGNFVSAHMVADNLGDKYPNVTSGALLDRMATGRSLGQAMQDLKVSPTHITSTQEIINNKLRIARVPPLQ